MNLRTILYSPVTVGFLDCDSITPQNRRMQSSLTRKKEHSFHTISLETERGKTAQERYSLRSHSNPILFPGGSRSPFLLFTHPHHTLCPAWRSKGWVPHHSIQLKPWGKNPEAPVLAPWSWIEILRLLLLERLLQIIWSDKFPTPQEAEKLRPRQRALFDITKRFRSSARI